MVKTLTDTHSYDVPISASYKEMNVNEFNALLSQDKTFLLIDVRDKDEYEKVNLGGKFLPFSEFDKWIETVPSIFPKDIPIIIHCKGGGRSREAVKKIISKYPLANIYNLQGGIKEWYNIIENKSLPY
jgi:sulfur-carrier protein adenylyltransferase/sulfurtransferase